MNSFNGLLIYFVIIIISSIIKKVVEEKAKQQRIVTEAEWSDSYDVSLEDMLAEDSLPVGDDLVVSEVDDGREFDFKEETFKDVKLETVMTTAHTESRKFPRRFELVQAVIMSEIIKKPRAQRPWPNR